MTSVTSLEVAPTIWAAPVTGAAPPSLPDDDDFAGLLADVADAIVCSVPPWRVRLGEAVARWQGEGVDTAVLQRALALAAPPDVDGLLATFEGAVARLRALEREAAALDPAQAGAPRFRDPARLREAHDAVAALRAGAPRPRPALRPDPELWVEEWPDVAALLVEAP